VSLAVNSMRPNRGGTEKFLRPHLSILVSSFVVRQSGARDAATTKGSAVSTIATTLPARPATGTAARTHPVRRAALISGAVAAVITTGVAAVAHAAGVPLEIDGETIPLAGFAEMTLLGAALGGMIAAALNRYGAHPRRWFVRAAVVLTVLSCVPSVAFPPDVATRAILVTTHVIAALVIVPALAHQTRR
jgi:hypothetical protein